MSNDSFPYLETLLPRHLLLPQSKFHYFLLQNFAMLHIIFQLFHNYFLLVRLFGSDKNPDPLLHLPLPQLPVRVNFDESIPLLQLKLDEQLPQHVQGRAEVAFQKPSNCPNPNSISHILTYKHLAYSLGILSQIMCFVFVLQVELLLDDLNVLY